MAVSAVAVSNEIPGRRRWATVDITFDSSYSIGGEAITPATFGLLGIDGVLPFVARNPQATDLALLGVWDSTNSKLILFWGDNNNAADAPLIEVPDTTDVSAYVARVVAIGW